MKKTIMNKNYIAVAGRENVFATKVIVAGEEIVSEVNTELIANSQYLSQMTAVAKAINEVVEKKSAGINLVYVYVSKVLERLVVASDSINKLDVLERWANKNPDPREHTKEYFDAVNALKTAITTAEENGCIVSLAIGVGHQGTAVINGQTVIKDEGSIVNRVWAEINKVSMPRKPYNNRSNYQNYKGRRNYNNNKNYGNIPF